MQEACPLCHNQLKSSAQREVGTDEYPQLDATIQEAQPEAPGPSSAEVESGQEREVEANTSAETPLPLSCSTG